MHVYRIGVLKTEQNEKRSVFYEDGIFSFESADQVSPHQLIDWSNKGLFSWEQPGMREWVARRGTMTPAQKSALSHKVEIPLIIGITTVLIICGILLSWWQFQAAKRAQAEHYDNLIEAARDMAMDAESQFTELTIMYPEIDADAIIEAAKEAE